MSFIDKVFRAARNWGWLLSLVVAASAVFLWWGADKSGLDTAINDNIVEPVGVALSIVHTQCPSGWTDVSAKDEHQRVLSCERRVDGVTWLVVLKPDGTFNYGLPLDTPGATFVYEEGAVPGWPR